MFFDLLRLIVRTILKGLYGFEVRGLEKVPKTGKLILACNHCSNADPPIIESFLNGTRRVRFIAKRELFAIPFIGWLLRSIGAVSVDRKKAGGDLHAMRTALELLEQGECLIIFPEGTRAKDGKRPAPKPGIGFLAARSGAPVLTAKIRGMENFPFTRRVSLEIGSIHTWDDRFLEGKDSRAAYIDFSNSIMSDIYTLTEGNASCCGSR